MPDTYLQQLIQHFGLRPLTGEGGLWAPSYRAADLLSPGALPERYTSAHAAGGAIYFLLTAAPDSYSCMHSLPTDETYHFYLGDAVEMLLIWPDGRAEHICLGQDVLNGQQVQFTVPAGVWQGSRLRAGGHFALLGTTMAPAYESSDFIPGSSEALCRLCPTEKTRILQLSRYR